MLGKEEIYIEFFYKIKKNYWFPGAIIGASKGGFPLKYEGHFLLLF